MKIIIALFFFMILSKSQNIFDIRKQMLSNNTCFVEQIQSTLLNFVAKLENFQFEQNSNLEEYIMENFLELKVAYSLCDLDNINSHLIQNLGEGFLLTSRCEKDLGGVFMLVDSVIFNPKDIKKDLISAILLLIYGRQSFLDCQSLILFILQQI